MKKFSSFLLMACGLMLGACSDGDDSVMDEKPPVPEQKVGVVSFTASLNPASKATDTQFESGDAIGVFAVVANGSDNKGVLANSNYADNVKYTYDGSKFTNASGIKAEKDKKYFYHAVYPYTSDAAKQFTFKVKADQQGSGYTQSDLCTAHTDATPETTVPLKFSHRLSKLIITLKGENWPSGDMAFKINGVKVAAEVDLNTLDFNAGSETGNVTCSGNGTKSFKVILPPQVLPGTKNFGELTIGSKTLKANLGEEQNLLSGKQLEITYTYTPGGTEKLVEFVGDIHPWDDTEMEDNRFANVVPDKIREQLEKHIPIYDGKNPPVVEGSYIMSPYELVYNSDPNGSYKPGKIFKDRYLKFTNQNKQTNQLDFEGKQGSSIGSSKNVYVSGNGDNFTVFFNSINKNTEDNYTSKTAVVISGTKTAGGIKNARYAFIMVEHDAGPDVNIMDPGEFRAFRDKDGLAENKAWTKSMMDNWNAEGLLDEYEEELK